LADVGYQAEPAQKPAAAPEAGQQTAAKKPASKAAPGSVASFLGL
jgi:hypothetical protein